MPSPDCGWYFFISKHKRVYRSHQNQGLTCELGANKTAIEGYWDKVFECVRKCHEKIHAKGSPRIYRIMKVNTRTDIKQKFADRVNSVLGN